MRIVLQRVSRASVTVDGSVVGSIASGLLVLVGIEPSDTAKDIERGVEKVVHTRIFPDDEGRMNLSLADIEGSALVVSQFTLLGDARKGRRPSYIGAAPPEIAEPMIDAIVDRLRHAGIHVETGVFGAAMEVEMINSGPVTLVMTINQGKVR